MILKAKQEKQSQANQGYMLNKMAITLDEWVKRNNAITAEMEDARFMYSRAELDVNGPNRDYFELGKLVEKTLFFLEKKDLEEYLNFRDMESYYFF